MSDICNRLRGKYSIASDGVIKENRDFGDYTPAINKEAADLIESLQVQVRVAKGSKVIETDFGRSVIVEIGAWGVIEDMLGKAQRTQKQVAADSIREMFKYAEDHQMNIHESNFEDYIKKQIIKEKA